MGLGLPIGVIKSFIELIIETISLTSNFGKDSDFHLKQPLILFRPRKTTKSRMI